LSVVDVPGALLGLPTTIGLAAASGAASYADGGWLVDGVKVVGEL
jgi:hypothetical protein